MVVDHHHRPLRKRGIDAAGGIGEDQGLHAEAPEHAHGERDGAEVVPFICVAAARKRGDRSSLHGSNDQPSLVPGDADRRPVR